MICPKCNQNFEIYELDINKRTNLKYLAVWKEMSGIGRLIECSKEVFPDEFDDLKKQIDETNKRGYNDYFAYKSTIKFYVEVEVE